MPSGTKKRKAAKKKKEKEANNTTTTSSTHSHGDDDLKIHEKESDGGEVSSPVLEGHHNQRHTFIEGEEEEMEKREDTSSVRSIVPENEPMVGVNNNGEGTQKVAMEENSVIQIDWELNPEDDSDSKKVSSIEYVESVKESNGGRLSRGGGSSSSSSSSSSSDDESQVVEKNTVGIESGESQENASNSVAVKTADLPELPQVTDGVPVMDAYNLAVGDLSSVVSAPITNMGSQAREDKVSSMVVENSAVSSFAAGFAAQEDEDKLLPSSIIPAADAINGAEHVKDSVITEYSDSQPLVASAPRPVQTTSWMSCCGLFEVFSGSNR